MSSRNARTSNPDDELTGLPDCLRDPWGTLQRRWKEMAAVFLVVLVAGVVFVHFKIRPEYLATASVLLSSQGIEADFVASPVREGAFEKISAMVGETLSTESLAAVIERHNLYPEQRQTMSLPEVAGLMRRQIVIEPDESIGPRPYYETARVFKVSFRDGNPSIAAAVANDVAQNLATSGVRLRRERLQLASELLVERMEEAKSELALQEGTLSAYRKANWSNLAVDDAAIQSRIAELSARLSTQLSRYTALHPEAKVLRHEVGRLSAQLEGMHAARERVIDLERQVTLAETRLLDLEQKVQATEMAYRLEEASERSVASVLDAARPPKQPTRTPGKFLAASVLGALGLAAFMGVLREYMDPVVLGVDQIEEDFGLQVLGGVTRIS